ncbi:hypothetical protein [Paracoccus sp. (in: a-proteobacteria)]|uniref:hypothetical protein n=1 Tax=Paracoccus sp. TaxID=267 RepID=UPI0026DFE077|nr:hypothetical protein [Paracoccus sp. (in: a-proteobacteria)]MDO5648851.1 hypothetical protein [Paracoccus sp. (in: a-proteobacteria)]
MPTPQQIITDLRAHAARLDGTHIQGCMMTSTCRALRRGADQIESLLSELTYLRGFADDTLTRELMALDDGQ